jgi:hypothetical protein
VTVAVLVPMSCGNSAPSGAPAQTTPAAPTAPTAVTSVTAPVTPASGTTTLTKADFASRVQAALRAKGTFRVVSTSADDPDKFTSDIRLRGAQTDATATGAGYATVRVGGQVYVKGEGVSSDPRRPWVKLKPAGKDPLEILTQTMVRAVGAQAVPHQLLGGAAHVSTFKSAPGTAVVDGVPTKLYRIGINVPKAAAAKAFGDYILKEVTAAMPKVLVVKVWVDADDLPRKFEFDPDQSRSTVSMVFSRFGDKVTIAAPPVGLQTAG